MTKTSTALENLRGYAILIVVAVHSCIAYLGSQPDTQAPFDTPPYSWMVNPIVDSARSYGFDLFCAIQFPYMMHLMFFLSGLFVWPSLQRKNAGRFLFDRFLRLGMPFLLGVYLLMPIAYYPVYRVTAVDPSWSAFWSHWIALPFWPNGPLWFLWYLLALNICTAGLYRFVPRAGELLGRWAGIAQTSPGRFCMTLIGVSAVAYLPCALVFKPWQWISFGPFNIQASMILPYAIFFFAGLGVGIHGFERGLLAADGMLVRRWAVWLAAAGVAFVLWIIPTALIFKASGEGLLALQIVAALAFVTLSATACLGVTAVFLRFATVRLPVLNNLSDNAYGIYFFHYVFIIWLQYLLLGVALFALAKAVIVFTVTLLLSWAATAAFCSLSIGARLMSGKRRAPARTSAPSPVSASEQTSS